MRNLIILMCVWLTGIPAFGQNEGTRFQDLTFDKALQKALSENKRVFMDCYIRNCVPCKQMDQEVFSLDTVGRVLDAGFVCIKLDMQAGEGLELANRFQVKSFPTYLILEPEGKEIGRIVGRMPLSKFLEKLKEGTDDKNNLSVLREQFKNESLDKDGLALYLNKLIGANLIDEADVVYNKLFPALSKDEKLNAKYWSVYSCYKFTPLNSANLQFFLENKKTFEKQMDKKVIDDYFYNLYFGVLQSYIGGEQLDNEGKSTLPPLDIVSEQVKMLNLEGQQKNLVLWVQMAQARVKEDYNEMISCTEEILKDSLPDEKIWALATFYLTKEVANPVILERLGALETVFCDKLKDKKIVPFIKGSLGRDRTRPPQ